MKIFYVHEDIYHAGNPYIYSLAECIKKNHNDFSFGYGRAEFWNDEVFSYDIVHFHWPQSFIGGDADHCAKDLKLRIEDLHKNGIKVFATCHDLTPHKGQFTNDAEAMSIVYSSSDVIIHLGEYSKSLFEKKYPQAQHYICPHHIYDTVYSNFPTKEESSRVLNLNPKKKYILCFGTYRNDEEREITKLVAKALRFKGFRILAPGYMWAPSAKRIVPFIPNSYEREILKLRYIYGIQVTGKVWNAVPDELLPYYYGASEMCFIQRKDILNSGNAIMPMLYDKVVVGPNVGNVGIILNSIGYPTFNPNDERDVVRACKEGLNLASTDIASKLQHEFRERYSTEKVSDLLYAIYNTTLTRL